MDQLMQGFPHIMTVWLPHRIAPDRVHLVEDDVQKYGHQQPSRLPGASRQVVLRGMPERILLCRIQATL
jgi:hypothetical protein